MMPHSHLVYFLSCTIRMTVLALICVWLVIASRDRTNDLTSDAI